MDWVFKASSSWDLTELDSDDFDVLNVIGKNQNAEILSVDPSSGNKLNEEKHSTISSSSSGLSKKPRGYGNEQNVSCLVDGCTADLSGCRDYHRRHRVCESHSKTPVVAIGGKEQRFCQQCSRFHSLGEFDDVKRSCRKRLDGHNRRRRKPRTESMFLNSGSFLTNHQGAKLLRFGGSPACTTTFGSPLTWPEKEKFNQKLRLNSCAHGFGAREKKFPFLLGTESDEIIGSIPEPSYRQGFNEIASTDLLGEFSERLAQLVEPKGALSLLSSPNNLVQSPGTNLQFNGPLVPRPDPHLPVRNVTGPNSNHLIGMIHFRAEGLLENEAAQILSFSWE